MAQVWRWGGGADCQGSETPRDGVAWLSATAREGRYTESRVRDDSLEKIVLSPEFDVLKTAPSPCVVAK